MNIQSISPAHKDAYNAVVTHPLQSYEWGEFREKEGIKVIRKGFFEGEKLISGFQITIHPIPHTSWTIGYLPKGNRPDKKLIEELTEIGKQEKCIFIQLEPNVIHSFNGDILEKKLFNENLNLITAAHPLFTKYNFILDIQRSEEDILRSMHPKTRYNIKVAHKHGVEVIEDSSPKAFAAYWKLTEETTTRQKFYAHTRHYHELQWETLSHPKIETMDAKMKNKLTSHLLVARYKNKILTAMLFFIFRDAIYYPYGASSNEYRNVMHSTLTMWKAVGLGKILGLRELDMWGALDQSPNPKDPWLGFHTFKQRYGPDHVEYFGSYDLVINPAMYHAYKVADKLRWLYLRMKK